MRYRSIIILILAASLMVFRVSTAYAYGVDPVRAAMIDQYSKQAKKALEAQNRAQALMTTGHLWMQTEIEATTNFQREFNEYLDKFHDILGFAAEIYGIYYEVTQISKNVSELNSVVSSYPANALAVAFHTRRNVVYRNIIINGVSIVMDIKTLCFDSSKMTEQEKNEMITNIRPKLRAMNRQLRALGLAIRYTTFLDVWNEITDRARSYGDIDKREIIERCMRDWKNNANK
jgi:hypothetical protein